MVAERRCLAVLLGAVAALLLLQGCPLTAAAAPGISQMQVARVEHWGAVQATHPAHEAASSGSSRKPKPVKPACQGSSCTAMSKLLPMLEFKDPKQTVKCACQQFIAGQCFAPGCFVCSKQCFTGDLAYLAAAPGPFGTGLLCSSGCLPCCQRVGDASKPSNSTCDLVGDGC